MHAFLRCFPPTCFTGSSICSLHPASPNWLTTRSHTSGVDMHIQECRKLLEEYLACLQSLHTAALSMQDIAFFSSRL